MAVEGFGQDLVHDRREGLCLPVGDALQLGQLGIRHVGHDPVGVGPSGADRGDAPSSACENSSCATPKLPRIHWTPLPMPALSAMFEERHIKNSQGESVSDVLANGVDPPHLLRGRFGDFEELAEATTGWDLDFRQLDRGASPGELVQLAEPQTSIMRARLGRRYHQLGSSPPGTRTFALVEEGVAGVRWCGHSVTETTLMTFHPGGDFEAVSPPGFDVYTLSFSEGASPRRPRCSDSRRSPILSVARRRRRPDHSAIQDLRGELRLLCGERAGGASTLGASPFRQKRVRDPGAGAEGAGIVTRRGTEPSLAGS